jgi:hypothetical protein
MTPSTTARRRPRCHIGFAFTATVATVIDFTRVVAQYKR